MEDGEEGRETFNSSNSSSNKIFSSLRLLMTFEDTPPEKEAKFDRFENASGSRGNPFDYNPSFIKTQQNVTSASELKVKVVVNQRRKTTATLDCKKNENSPLYAKSSKCKSGVCANSKTWRRETTRRRSRRNRY